MQRSLTVTYLDKFKIHLLLLGELVNVVILLS